MSETLLLISMVAPGMTLCLGNGCGDQPPASSGPWKEESCSVPSFPSPADRVFPASLGSPNVCHPGNQFPTQILFFRVTAVVSYSCTELDR